MSCFPPGCEENDPDSKSGQEFDQDKPCYSTPCQGDVVVFMVIFVPDSQTFETDPTVIESVSGSVPVEHPHKVTHKGVPLGPSCQ